MSRCLHTDGTPRAGDIIMGALCTRHNECRERNERETEIKREYIYILGLLINNHHPPFSIGVGHARLGRAHPRRTRSRMSGRSRAIRAVR